MQAGRVIDQRGEYRTLVLAGTDLRTLDRARFRETLVPLAVSVGVATAAVLLFMVPVLGINAFTNASVALQFLLCVLGASALVLAGAGRRGSSCGRRSRRPARRRGRRRGHQSAGGGTGAAGARPRARPPRPRVGRCRPHGPGQQKGPGCVHTETFLSGDGGI